jgi:hypothetical protein
MAITLPAELSSTCTNPATDRGTAELSSIPPGRAAPVWKAKVRVQDLHLASCMLGSVRIGWPLGRSQPDGSEDHRGDPINGGLKAHGTLGVARPPLWGRLLVVAANAASWSVPLLLRQPRPSRGR